MSSQIVPFYDGRNHHIIVGQRVTFCNCRHKLRVGSQVWMTFCDVPLMSCYVYVDYMTLMFRLVWYGCRPCFETTIWRHN